MGNATTKGAVGDTDSPRLGQKSFGNGSDLDSGPIEIPSARAVPSNGSKHAAAASAPAGAHKIGGSPANGDMGAGRAGWAVKKEPPAKLTFDDFEPLKVAPTRVACAARRDGPTALHASDAAPAARTRLRVWGAALGEERTALHATLPLPVQCCASTPLAELRHGAVRR
jgi:hypothetical protein